MFCKQCGNKLEEGAKFCNGCGAAVTPENNNVQSVQPTQASSNDNTKVFKVLSYFGLLFLIGMFVKEKDDKSVRFHVGQGMILCIAGVATSIVYSIISAIAVAFNTKSSSCFTPLGSTDCTKKSNFDVTCFVFTPNSVQLSVEAKETTSFGTDGLWGTSL